MFIEGEQNMEIAGKGVAETAVCDSTSEATK